VPGEELRRDDPLGGLLGDGLGAVLAELGELAPAVLFRPCAARAVEAMPLVEAGQRRGGTYRTHRLEPALQGHQHRLHTGGLVLRLRHDHRVLVIAGADVLVGVATGTHTPSLGL
jgi:hypothetical protein